MRWSIRAQVVALVGLVLLVAMGAYLGLATHVLSEDKEASVYDVDALVASTVATQVDRTVQGISDRLRYFGQEYLAAPAEAERRARAFFAADEDVLSVEVHRRAGDGFHSAYRYVDGVRLEALNLSADDLSAARHATPVPLEAVVASGVLLQNASTAPDLALLRVSASTADGAAVVVADLRPEWLLASVASSGAYRVFVVDALGRVLAHPEASRVIGHDDVSVLPVVRNALEGRLSRGAEAYVSGDAQWLAAWARVPQGGAVVVEVPRAEVFRATRELTRRSMLFAAGVVGIALALAVALGQRITRPLRRLQGQMAEVSRGELGVAVAEAGPEEIRALGRAFNHMSGELVRRAEALERANVQLVQSEKLSAVGELAASVAHEVKNPMVGVIGFAQLGRGVTDVGELHEYLRLIEQDALRANKILENLLEFSRPPEPTFEPLSVNEVVQSTLLLCRHQLQLDGASVDLALADGLPPIRGSANQLRQVLLNLFLNAAQAMASSPVRRITVTTAAAGDVVEVRVADTGPGIAEAVQGQLFKPFVTTRPRGKGTGLGLPVSKNIVEAHHGTLRAESAPGEGATFVIALPATAG